MHHWLQTLNRYNIITNGTIPASESHSFGNTGMWSGEANNGSNGTQQIWQFSQWDQAPVTV